MPFVEVERRIKNRSFIAKKAITYSEEQSVLTKAPVTKVKINNISKSSNNKSQKNHYRTIPVFSSFMFFSILFSNSLSLL